MFLPSLSRRTLSVVLAVVTTAAVIWFATRPDPRVVFLRHVDGLLELANNREHGRLLQHLSPEAETRIREEFMPPVAAINLVRQMDTHQNRIYRAHNLNVFHARDYAEIEIERSAPGREFDGIGFFAVPFVWRDGKWWVAGAFRTDQDWDFPE